MFALDTDTLSRLHAVTRIEILEGRFDFVLKAADGGQLLRAFAWLVRSEELLRQIPVLPINTAAAAEFDRLRHHKKLKRIGRADLLIAAVALAHTATLVTSNLRHFRQVPGLQVENWIERLPWRGRVESRLLIARRRHL